MDLTKFDNYFLLNTRPTKHETMLIIANVLSNRGTCVRKKVGCVITDVRGNILAGSYNGQSPDEQHCDKTHPCPAASNEELSCHATHAEINGLLRCDPDKVHTVYITEKPCFKCERAIRMTTAKHIMYLHNKLILEIIL